MRVKADAMTTARSRSSTRASCRKVRWCSRDSFRTNRSAPVSNGSTSALAVTSSKNPRRAYSAYVRPVARSEEHTSELQSRLHLVCRLLLEKKKNKQYKSDVRKSST